MSPETNRIYQLGMTVQVREAVEKSNERAYGEKLRFYDVLPVSRQEEKVAVSSWLKKKGNLAPRARFELATLRLTAKKLISSRLAGLALPEGIQQVAMKPDESLSLSLFTLHSYFAAIHHY
jgi:hypothetical protein